MFVVRPMVEQGEAGSIFRLGVGSFGSWGCVILGCIDVYDWALKYRQPVGRIR